jgi:hypothetical protein
MQRKSYKILEPEPKTTETPLEMQQFPVSPGVQPALNFKLVASIRPQQQKNLPTPETIPKQICLLPSAFYISAFRPIPCS